MSQFDFNIVKDPTIFQQNRLPAHSDHEWYTSKEAVKTGRSDQKVSLNGVWYFHYAKNPSLAPAGFEAADYNVRNWDRIRVPAHIQMEGYDIPQYANTQYPWEGRNEVEQGEIPMDFNPTASYVTYINVPKSMKNSPVYIQFDGVESGFALWCNGEYVGYSEDSFTPSAFELTPYLKDGENKLAVQVYKWTAGSWCEDQDFYRFSGIFRDVYLYTVPKIHIQDLSVQTMLDDSCENAVLKLNLEIASRTEMKTKTLQAAGNRKNCQSVRILLQKEGEVILDETLRPVDNVDNLHAEFNISSPKLWSAEIPTLYDLCFEVKDERGNAVEYICEKVGFRRFELQDGLMKINGKRIVFKGTDRHEFSSVTGRVLSDAEILTDLITMKRHNINAIRTSHYPNRTSFYRMCDAIGLYVIDETNLETHGTWDAYVNGVIEEEKVIPNNQPQYLELIIDRARNMFERDKNHASVLIWSCGNESWGGSNLLAMSNKFREWDSTRLVHYEGVHWDPEYPDTTDIYSTMYMPVEVIKEQLKTTDKPYICCEYTHAMGNSCGAMSWYTDFEDEEPRYQGGFIWDYIDQSVTAKNRYGEEYQAYGGDLGDRPHDSSFSGNGIAYGGEDRLPSPKMQEVKYNYRNIKLTFEGDKVRVYNDHLFVNTDAFDAVAVLKKNGKTVAEKKVEISVKPLKTAVIDLPIAIPAEDCKGAEYTEEISFRLKEDCVWAKAGHEVAYGQGVYGVFKAETAFAADGAAAAAEGYAAVATANFAPAQSVLKASRLTIKHGYANIGVEGEDFEAIFSLIHGGLVSYKYCGRELLDYMPRPNYWRAVTENDFANLLPARAGQWKIASTYSTIKYANGRKGYAPVVEEGKDHVTVTYTYPTQTVPSVNTTMSYTVWADGRVDVHEELPPSDKIGELPEFGAMFTVDADFDRVTWYGRGPKETYWDRKNAKLGIYSNRVADNMAKYLRPSECGNKADVRWGSVTDNKGRGILFACKNAAMNFSALPYSPDQLDCAQHMYELPKVYHTYIRVSAAQMGVAGDDTWGALTHPEYMIDNTKTLSFDFSFRGI